MNVVALTQPHLTQLEARQLADTIRRQLDQAGHHVFEARKTALDFKRRAGWVALGYPSFAACAKAEFGQSYQHLYRLVRAEQIAEAFAVFSPTGETPELPETHARELKRLPTPEAQHQAYQRAATLAAAEQTDLTIKHIRQAVQIEQQQVLASQNPVVSRLLATGDITPAAGAQLVQQLATYPARIQRGLLELMTHYGLRNPALLDAFADMLKRVGSADPSRVLQEVLRTGCLGGVRLRDATPTDLERAKAESRSQRISEGTEQKRQANLVVGVISPEPVVVTVYKFDAKRTLAELRRALGDSEFERLRDAILRE